MVFQLLADWIFGLFFLFQILADWVIGLIFEPPIIRIITVGILSLNGPLVASSVYCARASKKARNNSPRSGGREEGRKTSPESPEGRLSLQVAAGDCTRTFGSYRT